MNYMRNILHPRQVVYNLAYNETNFGQYPLCDTRTGWSHCLKRYRKTDLNDYGVGIVLYYQFLKYLGIMMLIASILSIPSYLLFYHGPAF